MTVCACVCACVGVWVCVHEVVVTIGSQVEIGGYFECTENQTKHRTHQTLHHPHWPTFHRVCTCVTYIVGTESLFIQSHRGDLNPIEGEKAGPFEVKFKG